MNQLVSIIVPCYNQAQYLSEALQSVLDQTYSNWECIIVNDGSPDSTDKVAKEWIKKDVRFKYLVKENGGLSSARNTGIAFAKGDFILPLDADDKINIDYITLAVQEFAINKNLKIVYCKAEKFGADVGFWNLPSYSRTILVKGNVIFCCALFKKIDWIAVEGYDENLIFGLEDWEFWIALLKSGGEVKCLDYLGFYYRVKDISMLKELDVNRRSFSENYVHKKHLDFVISNYNFMLKSNQILERKVKKLELDLISKKVLFNNLILKIFKINILKLK